MEDTVRASAWQKPYLLRVGSIFLVALIVSLVLFVSTTVAQTSPVLVHDFVPQEPSSVPAGTQTNEIYRDRSVLFAYNGGIVTFSTCPAQACTWAMDDAARLIVTRPDGTQRTRDFISDTKDIPAANVTDMFLVGSNTVRIQLIDRWGPDRGLSRPLYLAESVSPLPPPAPIIEAIPAGTQFTFNPYVFYSKDPVNTLTGSYTYAHADVEIIGRGPTLLFVRTYNSNDTRISALGPGWTHSYAMHLARPDANSSDIIVVNPQGRSDRYTRNADGSFRSPVGIYETLVRNSDGTYKVTNREQTSWVFDEAGRLQRIIDRYGNQSTLTYNASRQLVGISDPAGRGVLTLSYHVSTGQLTSVTDWIGRTVSYGYDASGRLASVTDREGKTITYGYDGATHRITTLRDARGNTVVTNTYDGQGRVATQKDARGLITGQQTTFVYNTNANGTKTTIVTYPATSFDPTWRFIEEDTYDAQGQIIKRVSKPVASSGEWITEEYSYDANGNQASVKDGRGNITLFCYDVNYSGTAIPGSRGNLTRLIDPPPTAGASRPVTLYSYDGKNNLVQTIPPKGVASNAIANCTTNLSGSLNLLYATNRVFDAETQTKLLAESHGYTDPDLGQQLATIKYEYADLANPGLPTRVIPPRGNSESTPDYSFVTTYVYAANGSQAGMLVQVTAPLSATTTYVYDAVGRLIQMVDPRGNEVGAVALEHTWEYAYDNEDRQRFVKTPPPAPGQAQLISEYRYDEVGNQVGAIDANGQVMRFVYDERDSLKEVHQSPNPWPDLAVQPLGMIITAYQYDHLGNLNRVIRAQGDSSNERVVDYVYDGLGRLRKETQYPNWPSTTTKLVTEYAYDKNSNHVTLKDPLGKTTTHAYDALNRQTAIAYNNTPTPNVSYYYDGNGNRIRMVDGTGTTTYLLDEMDRLLGVTSPGSKTVAYRYDLNGNRRKLIYPDQTSVAYYFNQADQLTSLVDWVNRTTSYEYFVDGALKRINHNNGTSAEHSYDNAGRLTQVWNKYGENTITRHTYTMDAVGNRTHIDEVLTDGYDPGPITPERQGTVDYVYDRMYRLTAEYQNRPFPQDELTLTYTYDPVGNRLSMTRMEHTCCPDFTSFLYDRADRILAADGDIDETYTVNANGNLVNRGIFSNRPHTYDQANRLVNVKPGVFTYYYTYDGDGKRTKTRRDSTTLNTYIYDVDGLLPVLLQDVTMKYVWGLGLVYVVEPDNDEAVYHYDGLGSMVALTQDNVAPELRVTEFEVYDAFGVRGDSNRLFEQPFYYAGEQQDEGQTEYQYLRARYYDPVIGRFVSRDPLVGNEANPLSLNRYSYSFNNPANFTDPSGLSSIGVCGSNDLGLIAYATSSHCLVLDLESGNVATVHSVGGGGSTGAVVGAGIGFLYDEGAIQEMAGESVYMGGSIAVGPAVGFDGSFSENSLGELSRSYLLQLGIGVDISYPGVPVPAEIHGGVTKSVPIIWFNLYDKIRSLIPKFPQVHAAEQNK